MFCYELVLTSCFLAYNEWHLWFYIVCYSLLYVALHGWNWHDIWQMDSRSYWAFVYCFTWHLDSGLWQTWKVNGVIHNRSWVLKDHFLRPIWGIICQQSVPVSDTEDTWCWNPDISGVFSLSSAWEIIRTSEAIFEFADIIWFPCNSPKMSICLLIALHPMLLTWDFLQNIGISSSNICELCRLIQNLSNTSSLNAPILYTCGLYASES